MAEEHKEIDALTGTATTGHEWDGLRELNTPLPRWWLWLFYITIVWAIGYWIVYPAWPLLNNSTQGVFGWHTRSAIVADLDELKLQRGPMMDRLASATVAEIAADPQLLDFARAQGRVAFADNCAPCHGAGGGGGKGYPNLNDDDWLWGGKLADIEQTIRHGARSGDDKGHKAICRRSAATGYSRPTRFRRSPTLSDHCPAFPPNPAPNSLLAKKSSPITASFVTGAEGKGKREIGAPNLTDKIWLYGADKATIVQGIQNGRGAVMPAWSGRLSEPIIKALTVYVYSFGGGEK